MRLNETHNVLKITSNYLKRFSCDTGGNLMLQESWKRLEYLKTI